MNLEQEALIIIFPDPTTLFHNSTIILIQRTPPSHSLVLTMQSSHKQILTVPTKIYDGGSSSSSASSSSDDGGMRRKKLHDSFDNLLDLDAFSFYSSQDNRMYALLGRDQEAISSSPTILEREDTSCHRHAQRKVSSDKTARRTRVSFEVHPSLLVKDFHL